jgi:hypothetical protein
MSTTAYAPTPTASGCQHIVPVISEQNTLSIAEAVIGLEPMFPVITEVWLPVFMIPVFVRITKFSLILTKDRLALGLYLSRLRLLLRLSLSRIHHLLHRRRIRPQKRPAVMP